jgi:hypothetical protein
VIITTFVVEGREDDECSTCSLEVLPDLGDEIRIRYIESLEHPELVTTVSGMIINIIHRYDLTKRIVDFKEYATIVIREYSRRVD